MRPPRLGAAAAVVAFASVFASPTRAQESPRHQVRGSVYDSLSQKPLAGAEVALLDRGHETAAPRSARTDSVGRFRFNGVEPGTYVLGFESPVLDSLGIGSPTRLLQIGASTADTVDVDLGRDRRDDASPDRRRTRRD